GAQLLRRYDVARRAMRFALRFQDPVTGGVYQDRERAAPNDPQILYLTCQLGMSALLTGYQAEAEAAGHFLKRLWAAQPELPDRLYTIYTRAGGLATAAPPGAARRHYVNESQDVRQGDWFVAEQFSDGHWENSRYLDPNPPLHRNIAITAEFVVHMDTIVGTLSTVRVD